MNPPKITDDQRAQALVKAAEARRARSELRRRLKSGEVTFAELLDDESRVARHMPVSQALKSMPGIGDAKAEMIMEACGICPTRRIRGLGSVQRKKLLDILSRYSR